VKYSAVITREKNISTIYTDSQVKNIA